MQESQQEDEWREESAGGFAISVAMQKRVSTKAAADLENLTARMWDNTPPSSLIEDSQVLTNARKRNQLVSHPKINGLKDDLVVLRAVLDCANDLKKNEFKVTRRH